MFLERRDLTSQRKRRTVPGGHSALIKRLLSEAASRFH